MVGIVQTWEGGTDGDTPTTANSGGVSGDPITSVSGLWASTAKYRAASAYASTMGCRIGLGSNGTGAAIWVFSATADRYASGIFFRTSLPTGGNDELISLRPTSGATAGVMITPAGELEISAGGIIGATSGAALATGTWYYLEFAVRVSTGTVELRLYLAGSATPIATVSLTGQTLSSTSPIGRVIVGRASSRPVIHTLEVDRIAAENLSTGFPARTDLSGMTVTAPRALVAITAPTPTVRANAAVLPPPAVATLAAPAPSLRVSGWVSPPRASVALLAPSPALRTSGRVSPPRASLAITAPTPTVSGSNGSVNAQVSPPAAVLRITARTPTERRTASLAPPRAVLQIRAQAPTARVSVRLAPPRAVMTLLAPAPLRRTGGTVRPPAAVLAIAAVVPTNVSAGRAWRDIELTGGISRTSALSGRVERTEITGTVRG